MVKALVKVYLYFFLFLGTSLLYSQEHSDTQYNSLLWEIRGNGLKKSSYLYGTMHVSQKIAFHLGDPFFKAIESSDVVALEINPDTWMDDLVKAELQQVSYPASMGYDNFYKEAFKIVPPLDRDISHQLSTDNNLINGLLYRSNSSSVEFEEDTYLDLYIYKTGKRMYKQVVSLENYSEVMDLSLKAAVSNKDDKQMSRRKWSELFKELSPNEVLQNAYRDENLNLVDSVSKLMNSSSNFHKYMIDIRNVGMANRMDSIMTSGRSLFTGIGAAHLPGAKGVIELLRSKGYEVTALSKGEGGKSKKYADKYDDLVVPVKFSKKNFPKAFYSLDVPGSLYEMPSYDNSVTYVHPDMINGVYYWVKRIKTYAALLGLSTEDIFSKVNDLLYENIPGEIVSKNIVKRNGIQGIDIVNRTRQGDLQRYRIYITPLEILIFKMGGTKNYAVDYGDRFINSIDLSIPMSSDKHLVSPVEGSFSLMLPDYHLLYRMRSGEETGGPGLEYQAIDAEGDYYLMRKTVIYDSDNIEEDDYELEQLHFFMSENDFIDTLMTRKTMYHGYPAEESSFAVSGTDKMFHTLMLVHGQEYYMLGVLSGSSFEECEDYLYSLKFEPRLYQDDFEQLTDSSMLFVVNTAPISVAAERYYKSISLNEKEEDIDDYEYKAKTRVIRSTSTGETVNVTLKIANAFVWVENIDSVWAAQLYEVAHDNSMNYEVINRSHKDSIYTIEALLTDTGSTRGILIKKILCNRRMYSLLTGIDTLSNPSEFVRSTYDSFVLLPDPKKELSIFERKDNFFFDCLNSNDSTKVSNAYDYIDVVEFDERDEKELVHAFNNFQTHSGDDTSLEKKASLLEAFHYVPTKTSIQFLKNQYLNNEDTVTYQLACLSALASMNTYEATKALKELMVDFPTIPSEISGMNAIYTPLFKSLDKSKILFPSFLSLGAFPEYKNNNLSLLSTLVYHNMLKPRELNRYKKQLINEAVVELKRQFASEEGGSSDDWSSTYKIKRVNYDLINYAVIIAPWYKSNDKVKKFFKDVLKLKNKKTLTKMITIMYDSSIPVSEGVITSLSKDSHTRSLLLEELVRRDQEEEFDDDYLDQDLLSFSQLVSEYTFENDTLDVELIDKKYIESKNDPGYYYFYLGKKKSSYGNEIKWAIYYNGPQPKDTTKVNAEAIINDKSSSIDKDDDHSSVIEDLIRKIEMKDRPRYGRHYSLSN